MPGYFARALLNGETVSRDGACFPLTEAAIRPAAPTPILIRGIVEGAIKRAGELGDGRIMGPFGGVEEFKKGWSLGRDDGQESR